MMTFTELEPHCGGVDMLHDTMVTILKLFLISHLIKPHPKKKRSKGMLQTITLWLS